MIAHVLEVKGLRAAAAGSVILHGVDLTVRSGEVHAVMGPNGSGKSTLAHVIMGRPGYEVLGGSLTLDGEDLLAKAPYERAQAGLFLAMQYPTEVPGVSLFDLLSNALAAGGNGDVAPTARLASDIDDAIPADKAVVDAIRAEAVRLDLDPRLLSRALNEDLSGGEKKKNETLQLGVLNPRIAVLDELDSGLDVDALRACSRRIEAATEESNLGVLAITHYSRLLHELRADKVHILAKGRIVRTGGPELAEHLDEHGYVGLLGEELAAEEEPDDEGLARPQIEDPFGDPLAGL